MMIVEHKLADIMPIVDRVIVLMLSTTVAVILRPSMSIVGWNITGCCVLLVICD